MFLFELAVVFALQLLSKTCTTFGCLIFTKNNTPNEKKKEEKIKFYTRAYQLIATSPSIELNWQQIASTYTSVVYNSTVY